MTTNQDDLKVNLKESQVQYANAVKELAEAEIELSKFREALTHCEAFTIIRINADKNYLHTCEFADAVEYKSQLTNESLRQQALELARFHDPELAQTRINYLVAAERVATLKATKTVYESAFRMHLAIFQNQNQFASVGF